MVQHQKISAFTLIELSVVLIIIGLLVGAVLVGVDLVKSSEMRSLTKQTEAIDSAVNSFKLKYNCLPGDCEFATSFFSGTVNGNGSGYVNNAQNGTASQRYEHWRFWQHLGMSELIPGSYSGAGGPNVGEGSVYYDAVIGTNVPGTSIPGVGISVWNHAGGYTAWRDIYGKPRDLRTHVLIIGGDSGSGWTSWAKLTVLQVSTLDSKIDDGLANSGKIGVARASATENSLGCTTGVEPNYSYDMSNLSSTCTLMMHFPHW